MIRKTLARTQAATYSIDLPDANQHGMPSPCGTGFFVSPDGWFVTAAHVITETGNSDGPVRKDIEKAWLITETAGGELGSGMCQAVAFEFIDPVLDFALLKVDFDRTPTRFT
jgi:S1-C subfamily serine protease